MAFLYLNGHEMPCPRPGVNFIVTTTVNSGRNANAEVVGQKIGRDQYKVNSLEWPWLSRAQWSAILKEFSNFEVIATFPDMVTGDFITLKMYPGDRTATPYWIDDSGNPTWYMDCKVNIIDCGVV